MNDKQIAILKSICMGGLAALAIVIGGALSNPFGFDDMLYDSERLGVAIKSALLPALYLALSIGRLAKHRFFNLEDIDSNSLSGDSLRARSLQSQLQNTLEQFVLALMVYLAWAYVMPSDWMSAVPLAATSFVVGRILFHQNYDQGASARALGFALTFYPSVLMLACLTGQMILQRFS